MAKLNLNVISWPIIFIIRVNGLWPSEGYSAAYNIYGYVLFAVFSVFLTLTMCVQMFAFKISGEESLTDSMYMALTEIALVLKIVNFRVRVRAIQRMMHQLKSFHLESEAEKHEFNKRLRLLFYIYPLFIMGANFACLSSHFRVFASSKYILPFPAFYGFDHGTGGIPYWLIYVHQTIGMTLTSNLNVNIDMMSNLLMFMCSVQMDILGMRLRSLGYDNADDGRASNQLLGDRGQLRTLVRLKESIQLHQQIDALSIAMDWKKWDATDLC